MTAHLPITVNNTAHSGKGDAIATGLHLESKDHHRPSLLTVMGWYREGAEENAERSRMEGPE